jgi:hypothetical protein
MEEFSLFLVFDNDFLSDSEKGFLKKIRGKSISHVLVATGMQRVAVLFIGVCSFSAVGLI